jgi:hypothetical protein
MINWVGADSWFQARMKRGTAESLLREMDVNEQHAIAIGASIYYQNAKREDENGALKGAVIAQAPEKGKLELAQLIVAGWTLFSQDKDMPAEIRVLSRGMKAACVDLAMPAWVLDQLHFADSREGFQCAEMGEIIGVAFEAGMVATVRSGRRAPQMSPGTARRLLRDMGVDEGVAIRIGSKIDAAHRACKAEWECRKESDD